MLHRKFPSVTYLATDMLRNILLLQSLPEVETLLAMLQLIFQLLRCVTSSLHLVLQHSVALTHEITPSCARVL